MTLVEVLENPERKQAVVRDSEVLLEAEVASKGGLSGAAIRTGFRTMKKVRPGVVAHALNVLLPKFAPVLDPHYATARASGDARAWFTAHADRLADDLLGVTDGLAKRAKNRILLRIYKTLRPQARKHVAGAMPRVADLCDTHVPA